MTEALPITPHSDPPPPPTHGSSREAAVPDESLCESPQDPEFDLLTEEEAADVRAGLRRGLADCAASRTLPLAEWAAGLRHRMARPEADAFPVGAPRAG